MDMPARPDGPPVRDGKPYSRIANLAEDIRAVDAVNTRLIAQGYSAPAIIAIDHAAGLALVEDFGNTSFNSMIRDDADISGPLNEAVELLADMASREWPASVALSSGETYQVPAYDRDALMIEAELCLDWYWPYLKGTQPGNVCARVSWLPGMVCWRWHRRSPPVWVMRDFHVDNLFWLPDRQGHGRIGLIDTQDCVLGHPAYDLASLLLDVRVTFPKQVSDDYLDIYCALRAMAEDGFDEASIPAGLRRAGRPACNQDTRHLRAPGQT
jgi:aminoglycoside/choline kinase family phosphotransferase